MEMKAFLSLLFSSLLFSPVALINLGQLTIQVDDRDEHVYIGAREFNKGKIHVQDWTMSLKGNTRAYFFKSPA